MSKEFIEGKIGSSSLILAKKQQDQINYFTKSKIQEDISKEYIKQWATRKYKTNDYFLNFVNTIFREVNFLSFFKYYRNPNPSSKLINTRVLNPLSRVFHSEDGYFNYTIRGNRTESPKEIQDKFKEKLFKAFLFNHNGIIIHDLKDVNTPVRRFISIDKVVAIKEEEKEIKRIAYSASALVNETVVIGYAYLDENVYEFYDKDYNLLLSETHDLGRCPAIYVSNEPFDELEDQVVKRSFFSYIREELEEYTFLKTLQRMTEPNGAIPITSQIDVKTKTAGKDNKTPDGEPMASNTIRGQQAHERGEHIENTSPLQTGTVMKSPVIRKTDGSIEVELAKNLITFFYLPVEALEYLSTRIKEVEQSIITSLLGDFSEANESAKNELQVSKSYVSKEDVLRSLSKQLSEVHKLSDEIMLGLAYGKDSVEVDIFYGSDFFMESQETLFKLYQNAPNPLERKNILVRSTQNRNRFNKEKSLRETILYKLLPYASDADFNKVMDRLDNVTIELQTRFDYWIATFEAYYGSIVTFWTDTDIEESQKLIMINGLLRDLINNNSNLKENVTEENRAS